MLITSTFQKIFSFWFTDYQHTTYSLKGLRKPWFIRKNDYKNTLTLKNFLHSEKHDFSEKRAEDDIYTSAFWEIIIDPHKGKNPQKCQNFIFNVFALRKTRFLKESGKLYYK